MMRNRTIAFLSLALLAGCDTEETETEAESAAEQPMPAPEPAMPPALLEVASLPAGGAYLTDADGRSLYTLEGEDDPAACVDACAAAWPPFTRSSESEVATTALTDGLEGERVGTVLRPDGSTQITYGGHPLYFYAGDSAAGETNGQDLTDEWGEWYLVQPSGELQEGGEAGGEEASES